MSVLPILPQGFVVGRILTSRGDSADADRLADTAVVVGMVDFTPATAYRKLDAATVVTHSKITAKLDSHGDLHPRRETSDNTGSDTEDGIWLPVGTWKVTYRLNVGFGALPEHNIEVTEAHTEAAPLPLFATLGDPVPAGATLIQLAVPLGGQQGQVLVMDDGSLAWGDVGGGGGGASELTPVTSNTTSPAGAQAGQLVGYLNTAAAAITVNGQPLAAGAWALFGWSGSAWVQMNTGTLIPATTPVTATAPTFNDASGTASDTYTIPTKAGVEYLVGGTVTAAGTYPGAGTVTITAQATSGYTVTGTSSWSHTFSTATDPTPVTPTGPTWTDDTGNGGGTWTTPTQTGVTYSPASGTATPGQSVTVTATAQQGYTLSGTTSWTHTFPAAPGATIVAADNFNRADGSLGSTSTGSVPWVNNGLTISGNRITAATPGGNDQRVFALLDVGADVTVSADIIPTSDQWAAGLILRYIDINHCYLLQFQRKTDTTQSAKLEKIDAGNWTTLGSVVVSMTQNTTHRISATTSGSSIAVRLDGVEIMTTAAADAHTTATQHGVYLWMHSTADLGTTQIDNVEVTQP